MNIGTVTVIGLGLIGGSIAKALKERNGIDCIIGIDTHLPTIEQALADNIISYGTQSITSNVGESDIIFICTPVHETTRWVKRLLPVIKPTCILTDVGSTKSALINEIENLPQNFRFVGGHPMAGSEKSGYTASKCHLFENAYYLLVPCSKCTNVDISVLQALIKAWGSFTITLSACLHDKVTSAISHVPHVISALLVNMVSALDTDDKHMQKLAAGGFKDITRISSSNAKMWQTICTSNSSAISEMLTYYIQSLEEFKSALMQHNDEQVYDIFDSAKQYRDTFTAKQTSLIPGMYELVVDVVDKPGIIGKIATILGEHSISIKNLNISNNREYEGGVLIISLPDVKSAQKAQQILQAQGYSVVRTN